MRCMRHGTSWWVAAACIELVGCARAAPHAWQAQESTKGGLS